MEKSTSFQMILERIPALTAHFRIAQRTRSSREKLRILVVEDQAFSRKILHELLHHLYIVDVAASAKEQPHASAPY